MRIGYLLSSLLLKIFLISPKVSSILFWGAKSTFVKITKNGIFKNKQSPMCSLVILERPILAPITTQLKSGARPVSPLIVVFKYFSWPHRSTRETILALSLTTSFQYLFLFWLNLSGRTCFPCSSKPIISCPIELVLPLSCSCLKLKTLVLAQPFPSSGMPLVRTETRVDFPASTLPIMPSLRWAWCLCYSINLYPNVLNHNAPSTLKSNRFCSCLSLWPLFDENRYWTCKFLIVIVIISLYSEFPLPLPMPWFSIEWFGSSHFGGQKWLKLTHKYQKYIILNQAQKNNKNGQFTATTSFSQTGAWAALVGWNTIPSSF